MDADPIATDARRNRRQRTLPPDAACLLCGETVPEALRTVSRSWLEAHHVVGEINDPGFTVPVCRNCHAKLTEQQRVSGVPLDRVPSRPYLEVLVGLLKGLSAFFVTLAGFLALHAMLLQSEIARLDTLGVPWRIPYGGRA